MSTPIDQELIRKITRYLCLCEQDSGSPEVEYDKVYRYRDGSGGRRQYTYSLGFTEDGGNLRKVVDRYLASGGQNAVLKANVAQIGKGRLAENREFGAALVEAGKEPIMQRAQDEVFREAYLNPALLWAEREGFKLPLSYAVAVDSYLHSGQMSKHLRAKFSERTPANGGSETAWMKAYLRERKAWFVRSTGALHTCIFRPKFFLEQIDRDNWQFACPLVIPEKGRIC